MEDQEVQRERAVAAAVRRGHLGQGERSPREGLGDRTPSPDNVQLGVADNTAVTSAVTGENTVDGTTGGGGGRARSGGSYFSDPGAVSSGLPPPTLPAAASVQQPEVVASNVATSTTTNTTAVATSGPVGGATALPSPSLGQALGDWADEVDEAEEREKAEKAARAEELERKRVLGQQSLAEHGYWKGRNQEKKRKARAAERREEELRMEERARVQRAEWEALRVERSRREAELADRDEETRFRQQEELRMEQLRLERIRPVTEEERQAARLQGDMEEEEAVATAIAASLLDSRPACTDTATETGTGSGTGAVPRVGAGAGPSSAASSFSTASGGASSGPLPPAQPAVEDRVEEVPRVEEEGLKVISFIVTGEQGGLRAARLQLGPDGAVIPLRPHPLTIGQSNALVAGDLPVIMEMFNARWALGIRGRLFPALHPSGMPATQPLPPPDSQFSSGDVRMGWNPAVLATHSLAGMRDGPDQLAGQLGGRDAWKKVQAATRLARENMAAGDWGAALTAWQSAARLLQVDSEGMWRISATRPKLQARLHTICAGVARSLLTLGREGELATWCRPADQLGLAGAAAWGAVAWGAVLSRQGRNIDAYRVFLEAGQRSAGVQGGPNMAYHLAAQALHRERTSIQPALLKEEEEEVQRDMRVGLAHSASALGGLVPPDQPYPICPDCGGPTALGPGGRHVCDGHERIALGARVWGDVMAPVADLASVLHTCGIGGTCGFSLEGQEVMACRGPAQCLVCRPCLLAWEDERQVDGRGTNRGHCVVCRHRVAAGESAYLPLQGTLLRMVELAGRVAGLTKLE